ncbi:Histidine kinase-like ATPase domain-containing protein [Streptomyces prasinopilosus]|uniref:Histidine kinase-like ATPase domain-containing protein n=2 Tax=Streptomyces prasinopilosus TaxID=67344 RepID=A0A1G7BFE6_9ACTN|nr:Histidine kinase-like ATPase domain-containing protein [Streptomyces prasinopilosus]
MTRIVTNTRRVVTIEREGGDRTMDDQGRGPGPRPEGEDGDRPAGAETAPPRPAPLPYEGVWRFTAPAVDASVPQARHAVRDLLLRQGVPVADEVVQGLLLIVSELVTNAVRHAALLSPTLAVEVAVGAEWVRVSVEDNHPYRPTALEADHGRTGGRGLLLVREITREANGVCDVEHTAGGGKVVWAALPLKPARR